MTKFSYDTAFSRNFGWVTNQEQEKLKKAKVAIAGMGGVGGAQAITLARLGVGNFHLADFDRFELHNFNRQAGANMQTLGMLKAEVIGQQIKSINPEANITLFEEGVSEANLEVFLKGADVFFDGLDVFVLDLRQKVYEECRRAGIPALTAGPLGMGTGMICFLPNGMSFETYFGFRGKTQTQKFCRWLIGVAPRGAHRKYLVDLSSLNVAEKRGPSTPMGVELSAGIAATEILKLIVGRGNVLAAPWSSQFDAYTRSLKKAWIPGGAANPLFRLMALLFERSLNKANQKLKD